MKELYLVKNGVAMPVYISVGASAIIRSGADDYAQNVNLITGVRPQVIEKEDLSAVSAGVVLIKANGKSLNDGFSVERSGDVIKIVSDSDRGIYYGIHDLLEKNADILWARGAREYAVEYIATNEIIVKACDYCESSPFNVRVWNTCGIGATGKDHSDDDSALYYARNKITGFLDVIEDNWLTFGVKGFAMKDRKENISHLSDVHPEWFMKNKDGSVRKTARSQSYINYYNKSVVPIIAEFLARVIKQRGEKGIPQFIMPDDPWFYMEENGQLLHEQPFTADDGTTVYPTDKNYKSTVYFNFINRVAKELKKAVPNGEFATFAYMYSEEAPAIAVEDNVYVMLAPIRSNVKHAYTDTRYTDNDADRDNIVSWAKKCKKLCMYDYWNSFKGNIYTRPILKVIKDNLLWYRDLGIKGLVPEGKLDCTVVENPNPTQINCRKFFDFNEAQTYIINKLMWNPEADIDALLKRYCKIVYKGAADDMLDYFKLIEQGWDSGDALVWYTTGGDVYILNFIIRAGIKDRVLKALENAMAKERAPNVYNRVKSVYDTLAEQIKIYQTFVDERALVLQIEKQDFLSEKALDYRNNPDSVWNRVKPLKVLRNYTTFEFYPKEAQFDCKMIFDGENLYLGFTVKDDRIVKRVGDELFRDDGKKVISYAETYIGGNDLNKSEYYGFISGVWERAPQTYINAGSPQGIPIPDGFKDVKFVKLSDNPDERYLFHVQVIPISALNVLKEDFHPYGSFVYFSNRFGRAGWKGNGLWSKQNFSQFEIVKEEIYAKS